MNDNRSLTFAALITVLVLSSSAHGQYVRSAAFPIDVQQRVLRRTCRLIVQVPGGTGAGSGVVVGKDSSGFFLATAPHVIQGAVQIEVQSFDRSYPHPTRSYHTVRPLVADTASEFALVHVAGDFPLSPLGICPPGYEPQAGSNVLNAGCAGGAAPTCEVNRLIGHNRFHWALAQSGRKGRSGGPAVSEDGFVIGVCCCGGGGRTFYSYLGRVQYALQNAGFAHLYGGGGSRVAGRQPSSPPPAAHPTRPPRRFVPNIPPAAIAVPDIVSRLFPDIDQFVPSTPGVRVPVPMPAVPWQPGQTGSAAGGWSRSVTIINGRVYVNGRRVQ